VKTKCLAKCEADYVISNCSCKLINMPGDYVLHLLRALISAYCIMLQNVVFFASMETIKRLYGCMQWRRNEFESGGAPVRSESGGTDPAQSAGNVLVVPLHFLALKAQLVVLVSVFVMVSTIWSVSCLLFFYSRCPPCQAICKSGGTCPRAP